MIKWIIQPVVTPAIVITAIAVWVAMILSALLFADFSSVKMGFAWLISAIFPVVVVALSIVNFYEREMEKASRRLHRARSQAWDNGFYDGVIVTHNHYIGDVDWSDPEAMASIVKKMERIHEGM